MNGDDNSSAVGAKPLRRFWRTAFGFWRDGGAWIPWALIALLVICVATQILVQYRLNLWNRDFFNALERRDGREILVIDLVRYDRMFDRDRRGPSEGAPRLERWEIDLGTGAVRTELRDDRGQEFPRINETLTGTRHRYGYTIGIDGFDTGDIAGSRVYKHDYDSGAVSIALTDRDLVLGEMCFVPNPGATAEDDGVLMGLGQRRGRDEGQLVILDAPTLETVATVTLPQRVPMGFHGNWCPRSQ